MKTQTVKYVVPTWIKVIFSLVLLLVIFMAGVYWQAWKTKTLNNPSATAGTVVKVAAADLFGICDGCFEPANLFKDVIAAKAPAVRDVIANVNAQKAPVAKESFPVVGEAAPAEAMIPENIEDLGSQITAKQSEIPYPADFPENWASMSQSEQESYITSVFATDANAGDIVFTRVEEVEPGVGSGFAFNAKNVSSIELPCPDGFLCQFHVPDDSVVFAMGVTGTVEATDATVRIARLIWDYEKTTPCTVWYKVWKNDTSNEVPIYPLGEIKNCSAIPAEFVAAVDTDVAKKVALVSELTGLPVNSIGHIMDGFAVFMVYNGDLQGTDSMVCPQDYVCVVTRINESWTRIEGSSQSIPSIAGAFVFDKSMFLNNDELMQYAYELVGTDISDAVQ